MHMRTSMLCAAMSLGFAASPALSAESNLNAPSGKASAISAPQAITAKSAVQLFVPITPCRSGRADISAGGEVAYQITGDCGIPAYATAIATNLSAVPTATGFLIAYPTGATRPNIASLNYRSGVPITSGTIVPLSSSGQLTIYATGTAKVYVDTTGYYVPAIMSASIKADGTITRGEGLNAGTTTRFSAGTYEVGFTRDVTECFYNVTAGEGGIGSAVPRVTGVTRRSGNPNGVFIQIRNDAGTNTDSDFFVLVSCGS